MFQLLLNGFVLGLIASPTCPSNAEEINQGTRYGLPAALSVGAGAIVGDALVLAAIWLGLYPIIQRYQSATTALWFLGAAVMAYVARGIYKEMTLISGINQDGERASLSPNTLLRAFWIGLSITTFNPFTALWWLGLLGPGFEATQSISPTFVLAVLIGSLTWFVALALILMFARHWLTRKVRQYILGMSGLAVLGYALFFLWKGMVSLV